MLQGVSLVADEGLGSDHSFQNEPIRGVPDSFTTGTPKLVNWACEAAEEAFWTYGYGSTEERAAFLEEVASQIDARGAEIIAMGMKEIRTVAGVCRSYQKRCVFGSSP